MSSFDKMCNEAVKRFIRTIAIIDDEATYHKTQPSQDKDNTKTVKSPVTGLMTGNHDADSSATNEDSTDARFQDNHEDFSLLDAKVVINAFADMGIACCIQSPKHEESPCERAVKLAASVDVLVIDWLIDKEDKLLPRDIIKEVLEEDKKTGGRMRLIVVYTAQPHVDQMITEIKEDADTVYDGDLVIDKECPVITRDCLRIVILNKEATMNSQAPSVPFDQLPNNIISEYTKLVKGVIPGATLHGIAAMREKTHELLAILNSNLDGAYCLHRALIPEPSGSVDFAMNLITNEIMTVIQADIKAREFVDRNGIEHWSNDLSFSELSKETVQQWLDKGGISKGNGKKLVKALYRDDQTEGLNGCMELSRLQCTTRDMAGRWYYSTSQQPTLQLGTILLKTPKNAAGEWFLCITPLCDCVRLKDESNFLFLQLYPGTKSSADIIIKTQDGTFEPLIVKNEKIRTLTIPFKPTNGSDRINANHLENEWLVTSNGTNYQWVGELRYTKALAIVHYVAANTSRVGVDEFEWLRHQATL